MNNIIQKPRAGQYGSGFDGANDMLLDTSPVGLSDTSFLTFAALIKLKEIDLQPIIGLAELLPRASVEITTAGKVEILLRNSSNTIILNMESSIQSIDGYISILASCDLSGTPAHSLYIDDASDKTINAALTGTIDYTQTGLSVGSRNNAGAPFVPAFFDLSMLYFNIDEYIDFSVEANRRLFFDANGKPAQLGSHGYRPTGNQPAVYLDRRFNALHRNRGYTGDFTPVGALAYAKGGRHG